jgi:hypothetical protein
MRFFMSRQRERAIRIRFDAIQTIRDDDPAHSFSATRHGSLHFRRHDGDRRQNQQASQSQCSHVLSFLDNGETICFTVIKKRYIGKRKMQYHVNNIRDLPNHKKRCDSLFLRFRRFCRL